MTKYPEIQAEEKFVDLRASGCFYVECSEVALMRSEIHRAEADNDLIHNNIANLINSEDMNCVSAIQYAVEIRRVENVVICGHYGCKGVTTAIEGCRLDFLGNWLRPIVRIADKYKYLLDNIIDRSKRIDVLCKLNVIEQVLNACRTSVVQEAWLRGQALTVHGLMYNPRDGLVCDLNLSVTAETEIFGKYEAAIKNLEHRWMQTVERTEGNDPHSKQSS